VNIWCDCVIGRSGRYRAWLTLGSAT